MFFNDTNLSLQLLTTNIFFWWCYTNPPRYLSMSLGTDHSLCREATPVFSYPYLYPKSTQNLKVIFWGCFFRPRLSGSPSLLSPVWTQRIHRPALFLPSSFSKNIAPPFNVLALIGRYSNWWVSKYDTSRHTVANQVLTLNWKQARTATSGLKSDLAAS